MTTALRWHRVPRLLAMAALTVMVLGPLYWITMSAFKDREEILRSTPTIFPEHPTLENFRELFTATDYPSYLTNSFIVALLTAFFTMLVSFAAAYGLYRLRIPGGNKVAGLILVAYMIPGTLLLVPLYQVFAKVQLVDTRNALVIVNVAFTAPFCTWLLRGFFFAIPRDIDEAAAVDGAGPVRMMFRIVLPLLRPGLSTVGVYAFVFSWTEFVFASQLLVSDDLKTLPIGLSAIMGQYTVNWGLLMAGTVCTVIPAIVPFLFAGRYFVGGLTAGAVK
ncbi:carbohydrate ABC transporter permease [Phytohabitans sp. ZYX-F-186]|uniref:Carbohydrate ABC transporter permease n=1 Tax=Phytohabitans maris TaxID=3071409 RepID=A0ABU0ZQV0_9ACTN|nr:carbohydrate ABC transporter permease [Phytohabitans sp. ZYX-F-186]MDQ7909403.1 carbohydrate ABC transporter permease [Phytohabitans sp. ZYX-F-186]